MPVSSLPRACCLIIAGCLSALSAFAARPWLKLKTEDVVVYSDASPKDVTEFAVGYTAFRHVFRQLFEPPHAPPPATVLLFRRLDTLHDYLPPSTEENTTMLSYTAEIDGDALIALAVDGDRSEALRTTYEFDTVWELGRSGYALPIWMSQGAGEVLASLQLSKTKCTVGDGPDGYEELWRQMVALDWNRFFDISTDSPEYTGPKAKGEFHAQAWALMHRILLDTEHGPDLFVALAARLHEVGGLEAVTSGLQVKSTKLETEINRHPNHVREREFPFDAAALRQRLQPQPAPEAEVHVQLANLLFATQKEGEAEAELARARSLAPDAPSLKEALARQALRQGEPDYAIQLYREAIAAGSTSPQAYFISARRWLDDNMTGGTDHEGDGGPGVDHAMTDIRRGLQLDPGNQAGYQLLGRAMFVASKASPDDLAQLEPGIVTGDSGGAVRYYRALLHRRLGQQEAFAADLKAIWSDTAVSDRLRKAARDQFTKDQMQKQTKEVERLVRAKQYADAHARIAAQITEPLNADLVDRYQDMDAWVSENEAWEGVLQARTAKKWVEVSTRVSAFIEKFPQSRVITVAHRIQQEAQQNQSASTPPPSRSAAP